MRVWRLIILLALAIAAPAAAQAPAKVALVIANGAYQSVPALTNPARDAGLIADALGRAGFSVMPVARDLGKPQLEAALREFKRRADTADIALVYYAGHGIELEEQNWLLPVDARIADPADAHTEGVALATVLRYVAGAKRARIVVLDACRNNPFALRLQSPTRTLQRGLRPVEGLPPGTVVAYSASYGQTAADGVGGQSSPFAAALAKRLVEPGLEVRFLFASVRDDVIAANASSTEAATRSQRPWIGAELPAEQIFFVPPRAQPSVATITVLGAEVRVSELGAEVEAFDAAARANNAQQWRAFVQRFPNGRLKGVAEASLASMLAAPTGADPLIGARAAVEAITALEWSASEAAALVARAVAGSSRDGLSKLADSGDARAQFLVGWASGFGHSGFPHNLSRTVSLMQAASASGFARAQTYMGVMISGGCCGLTRNEAEAVRLYRLAAAQGNAVSQAELGTHYQFVSRRPEDKAEAVRLLRLAAEQGSALAQANLGLLYDTGEGGLAQNQAESLRLTRLAAAQGHPLGQLDLGKRYEAGRGVPQDSAEALRLYRLSARQNQETAKERLRALGETW